MMSDVPVFDDFYAAINNGRQPFPWQARLAKQVAERGAWPTEIGVPTGLGKTACLDIAVWALAAQAHNDPAARSAPSRIWWVVNRRLLVDAATEHAEALGERLAAALEPGADDPVVGAVAEALASLSVSRRPLEVVRLRGGAAVGRPSDPAQPAIVLSTIPMYGSRLLFNGYGVSRSMRPIDAALAGTDSLVLIDEAHLAHHLIELLPPLAECDPLLRPVLPESRSRPQIVSLTATGAASDTDRFDLDDDDLANELVQRRVGAAKPTRVERTTGAVARSLTLAVIELLQSPSTDDRHRSLVVFVNTPKTAREVHSRLSKELGKRNAPFEADIELLTGHVREREAGEVRQRTLAAARTGAPRPQRNLIVIATQTLEVGADLDFDLLVTESCGVRSLTQRMGRLNRLGEKSDASAVYCHVPPKKGKWGLYGEEPAQVVERLEAGASDGSGSVDLGPGAIGDVLGPPPALDGVAPAILPALLWEWAKTATPPTGAAPVEPYFSGLQPRDRTVSVVWRAYVPGPGQPIWPPVRESESVDVPIGEAAEAFTETPLLRVGPDRRTLQPVDGSGLRPGDIIIVPGDAGCYDQFGWAPDNSQKNMADMAVLRSGIPIEPAALVRLFGNTAPPTAWVQTVVDPDPDLDDEAFEQAQRELVAAIREASMLNVTSGEWEELRNDLNWVIDHPVGEVPRLQRQQAATSLWFDELDEMSLASVVDLASHGQGVADLARRLAEAIGIPPDYVTALEQAAKFHDVGKADARFQRWLDPKSVAAAPVAKSDPANRHRWRSDRKASGWPEGGRHEELSRRLVEQWAQQAKPRHADLIQHLVVSHHGHGRPFLVPVDDPTPDRVLYDLDGCGVEVDADLSMVDWSQPERFRQLCADHGLWGLALLEALVRQADHRVSAGDTGQVEVL